MEKVRVTVTREDGEVMEIMTVLPWGEATAVETARKITEMIGNGFNVEEEG